MTKSSRDSGVTIQQIIRYCTTKSSGDSGGDAIIQLLLTRLEEPLPTAPTTGAKRQLNC